MADLRQRNAPTSLCHNDLHHLNVLDDGDRLWLVDWEYGGCGDPLFDLAGFFCQNDAAPNQRLTMLEAYGEPSLAGSPVLTAACQLFDYVQWLWFRLWIATHPGAAGEYELRASALAGRIAAHVIASCRPTPDPRMCGRKL
jgi:aminoglycoside phosphotransferase (APT) family kinase protein